MDYSEVLAITEREAEKKWTDRYPLALSDRPFKPTQQHSVFVRHSLVFGDGVSTALGTGFYRYVGLQYLAIFFQTGGGLDSIFRLAGDMVRHYSDRILRGETVSVVFQVASSVQLPKDPQGFSQVRVVCPFYFDTRG